MNGCSHKFVCSDDVSSVSVNINVLKEKKAIYSCVKKQAFKYDGIIFGGMVRDEIISEHHKKKFDAYIKSNESSLVSSGDFSMDFWNKDIHPESSARTIVPNDMDVYFNNEKKTDLFISGLEKDFNIDVIIEDDVPIKYSGPLSHLFSKKVIIKYVLGKTFTFKGYVLIIKLDIIYPIAEITMEPPFCNLDLLCNAFIQKKDGIKRVSSDTGTELDTMSYAEKMCATAKIIKNMFEFKTEICQIVRRKDIRYSVERYLKMLVRSNGFSWDITNLPYDLVEPTNERCCDEEICCICQGDLNDPENYDRIAIVTNNKYITVNDGQNVTKVKTNEILDGSKTHHKCLLSYIKEQLKKDQYSEEHQQLSIICPYKKIINYSYCFRKINWDKYKWID